MCGTVARSQPRRHAAARACVGKREDCRGRGGFLVVRHWRGFRFLGSPPHGKSPPVRRPALRPLANPPRAAPPVTGKFGGTRSALYPSPFAMPGFLNAIRDSTYTQPVTSPRVLERRCSSCPQPLITRNKEETRSSRSAGLPFTISGTCSQRCVLQRLWRMVPGSGYVKMTPGRRDR